MEFLAWDILFGKLCKVYQHMLHLVFLVYVFCFMLGHIHASYSFIPEPPVLIACSMQKQILQVIKAGPEGGLGAMQKLLNNP